MKKALQYVVSVMFVLAGIALLISPSAHAQAKFVPTRFTVVDEGKVGAPDVVLVPGLTSGREVWAAEAKLLAPQYRLHLVQVNGFAGQPAGANATGDAILPAIVEELHAYIASAKMKPVVVGHSLGGLLTLMLADKYPADVRKIVIVDALPFYGMLMGPQATVEMVKPMAQGMRSMLENQTPEQRAAGSQKTAESLVLNPEGRKLVQKNSMGSDRHVFVEAMYEDLQTDVRADLPKITVPALMLYPFDATSTLPNGQKASVEMFDGLYQGAYKPMPNAKLVRVDDSRHFIMLDQPAKFDALLQAFLK